MKSLGKLSYCTQRYALQPHMFDMRIFSYVNIDHTNKLFGGLKNWNFIQARFRSSWKLQYSSAQHFLREFQKISIRHMQCQPKKVWVKPSETVSHAGECGRSKSEQPIKSCFLQFQITNFCGADSHNPECYSCTALHFQKDVYPTFVFGNIRTVHHNYYGKAINISSQFFLQLYVWSTLDISTKWVTSRRKNMASSWQRDIKNIKQVPQKVTDKAPNI